MAKRHLPVLPNGFADPKLPRGTYSASQYGLYKNCAKAYEFSYVEGIKNPPSGVMLTGTSVHAGAEASHLRIIETQKMPSLEEAKAIVGDYFDAEKDTVEKWDEGLDAGTTKDRALGAYAAYHNNGLKAVKPIAAEQLFMKKIGTVPTIGYIDLIDAPNPGQLVVADMKTGKAAWSQTDLEKDPQFTLYSLATGILDVRLDNLVFLKAGPKFSQKTAKRDAQAQAVLVEDYEETTDLIKRGIFPKTSIDSWMCGPQYCGYHSMCRGRQY